MEIIKYHDLHPALNEFVASIFYMSRNADKDDSFFQIALPNHECFLSLEYDTDFQTRKEGDLHFPTKKFLIQELW